MSLDQQKAVNSFAWINRFEQIVKILGYFFGGLYIIGLLIANMHLQHLGLSDFSILQPRCIATGMLFVLYIIFAVALLAPIAGLIFGIVAVVGNDGSAWSRLGLFALLVVACAFAEFLLFNLVSAFYGSLTPWIIFPRLPEQISFNPELWFKKAPDDDPIRQFMTEAPSVGWHLFGHGWTAWTAVMVSFLVAAEFIDDVPRRVSYFLERGWSVVAVAIILLAIAGPGFARDVYPNLDQSVGGGQPTIARLQISGTMPLIEDGTTFRRVTEQSTGKDEKSYIVTEALVVWSQSASSVYISPLTRDTRLRPIAIDAKSVQIIQQVAQAVEVHDGTRIIAVHNLR